MNWRMVVRPEVEHDVSASAAWYDSQQNGLGDEFREEVIRVFDALAVNSLLYSRRLPRKDIRWCYPERFPYRVIDEVRETEGWSWLPPCGMLPSTTNIGKGGFELQLGWEVGKSGRPAFDSPGSPP